MMATIASLNVLLKARTGVFDRAMRESGKTVNVFASKIGSAGSRLVGFGSALLGVAAAGGLAYMLKRTADNIDATAKLSDRLGISTEDLVSFRHAAELAGAGSEAMDKGLENMVRRIGEAQQGTGEATKALQTLGLSAQSMSFGNTAENFKRIADRIKELPTPAAKAATAYQLFGRQGVALINTLELGSEGLARAREEAEKLGITFDRVDAAKVEAANDAITRLKEVFQGVFQTLAIQLAPVIEAFASALTEAGVSGGGMGKMVIKAFRFVAKAVGYVMDAVYALKIGFRALWAVIKIGAGYAVQGIGKLVEAIEWLINKVAGSKLGQKLGWEKVDWSGPIKGIAEDLKASGNKDLADIAEELATKELPSEKVDRFFDDVEAKAEAARKKLEETAAAKARMAKAFADAEAFAKFADEIDKANARLREQIATFGLSQRQAELWKLQQAGKNVPADYQDEYNRKLKETADLMARLDAMEAGKKAAEEAQKKLDDLMSEGQRVFEETRTPMEKYEEQIGKLRKLLDAGAINWDIYGRAVRQAREQLEAARDVGGPGNVGDFKSIRTAYVDVAGLNITQQSDPVARKLDESKSVLVSIDDGIAKLVNKDGLA